MSRNPNYYIISAYAWKIKKSCMFTLLLHYYIIKTGSVDLMMCISGLAE